MGLFWLANVYTFIYVPFTESLLWFGQGQAWDWHAHLYIPSKGISDRVLCTRADAGRGTGHSVGFWLVKPYEHSYRALLGNMVPPERKSCLLTFCLVITSILDLFS